MLGTYDKLIVVRHPLERLLSAYRNKLEAKYESSKYFQARFGKKIVKVPIDTYPGVSTTKANTNENSVRGTFCNKHEQNSAYES